MKWTTSLIAFCSPCFLTQLKKYKSVHRSLPMKALPNGSKQTISGFECSVPFFGSHDSAFNQVTPFLCCLVLIR